MHLSRGKRAARGMGPVGTAAVAACLALVLASGQAAAAAAQKATPDSRDSKGPKDPRDPKDPGDAQPLAIERHEELRFGKIVVLGTSGRIVVPVEGLTNYDNAVSAGGSTGPARVTFRGKPHSFIEVMVTAPIQSSLSPTGDLTLQALSVEPLKSVGASEYPNMIRMKLDSSGQNGIIIGGSLEVTPNGSSGVTTIQIPVTASYVDAF